MTDALLISLIVLFLHFTSWDGHVFDGITCGKVVSAGAQIQKKLATTLKTVFEDFKQPVIDLLKLDIEGAEQQVILEDPTSGEALKRCRIVYVEVHPHPYGNADEQGIIEKMKSLGFTHHAGRRGLAHFFVNGN